MKNWILMSSVLLSLQLSAKTLVQHHADARVPLGGPRLCLIFEHIYTIRPRNER